MGSCGAPTLQGKKLVSKYSICTRFISISAYRFELIGITVLGSMQSDRNNNECGTVKRLPPEGKNFVLKPVICCDFFCCFKLCATALELIAFTNGRLVQGDPNNDDCNLSKRLARARSDTSLVKSC